MMRPLVSFDAVRVSLTVRTPVRAMRPEARFWCVFVAIGDQKNAVEESSRRGGCRGRLRSILVAVETAIGRLESVFIEEHERVGAFRLQPGLRQVTAVAFADAASGGGLREITAEMAPV